MKKILAICFGVISLIGGITLAQDQSNLILFYGETCPHCKTEKGYIEELSKQYDFDLVKYEVYFDQDNQRLMQEYADKFGTVFNSVPVVIMGDDYFLGASYQKTEDLLKKYAQNSQSEVVEQKSELTESIEDSMIEKESNTESPVVIEGETIEQKKDQIETIIDTEKPKQEDSEEIGVGDDEKKSISSGAIIKLNTENKSDENQNTKILGKEISLNTVGPVIFGILLGLTDGINPCMFGVLIFLLTYLISIGSRKKILYSGLIFVVTTFALYFGIMYLMHKLIFSTMALLPYIAYIKYGIGVLAIIMGLIEIKDFFRYGKGISLAIPKFMKPTLEYITMRGTYMSAFILAVFSSFVELPCTIGIPLAYIGALGDKMNIFTALSIYNIFFIIPLVVIILGIYFGFSAFKSGDKEMTVNKLKNKKLMRLIAGIILIGIGILFLMRIL